jgi:hypothetical protein
VTPHFSASVQTGEPTNLAREGDPIGLTAEVGGYARPNHGLTTVLKARGQRFVAEISEDSPISGLVGEIALPGFGFGAEEKRASAARPGFRSEHGFGVASSRLPSDVYPYGHAHEDVSMLPWLCGSERNSIHTEGSPATARWGLGR